MWEWIKENSDWLCSVTFGRLPPGVRFFLGVLYEIFDYIMRVVALFVPGFEITFLDGPYILVCVLLAGGEGLKWAFLDFGFSFIPLGDWFPGLGIAVYKIWRGHSPDPGNFVFTPTREGEQRMGCLTYQFRFFLVVILSALSIYFGGQWTWSHFYDYRDQAWEQVKGSPRGLWAIGRDKVDEATGGAAEAVKPWVERGKRELKKKAGELSRSFGLGGRSKEKRMADARRGKFRQPSEEAQSSTPKTAEEAVEEQAGKNELLERAKARKLGPHASELYASETTTKVAEELRKKDLAYYWKWFWRLGIPNVLLIASLILFRGEEGVARPRRRRDYVGLDDDEV